jgi:heterodisulfide reductase subunit A-like polyferredoxin
MSSKQPAQDTFDGHHAVVIGGSMAGLLAARVLSDHFEQVTIIERDQLTGDAEARKGIPQGSDCPCRPSFERIDGRVYQRKEGVQ